LLLSFFDGLGPVATRYNYDIFIYLCYNHPQLMYKLLEAHCDYQLFRIESFGRSELSPVALMETAVSGVHGLIFSSSFLYQDFFHLLKKFSLKLASDEEKNEKIAKNMSKFLFDTKLETVLRNMEIKNLIFSGFRLDACLRRTMLDALYRNFKVILLRDCTLACELPEEIDNIEFTKCTIIWFEVLTGTSVDSKDFVATCETIL